MEKLSLPRFHVEISWNFDTSCKNSRLKINSISFSNFALIFLQCEKNHRFFGNYSSEKLSPRKFFKIHFFSKLAYTNTNNKLDHFLRFLPQTRNMIFLRTQKFRKKKCFDFFVSRLKIKPLIRKLAYVKMIFWRFSC
jgi:hypothetical protein